MKDLTPGQRALDMFVRTGEFNDPGGKPETRVGLTIGSPQVTQTASVLVQAGFYGELLRALKSYDRLLDPAVISFTSSRNGSSMLIPTIDDTGNPATVVTEANPDAETDPTLAGVLIPTAKTWRTGIVKVSREFLEDSAVDPGAFLTQSFALRLARGIGSDIVSVALAGAQSGANAASKTAIALGDIVALLGTIDPAYLAGPKAGIAMNWTTLFQILAGLITGSQAQAALMAAKELFGLPIYICPSLPSAGSSTKPVLAGDFSYVAVRTVEGGTNLVRLDERYAENGQIAFRGFLRASSAVAVGSALKYLTCPA